MIAAGAMKKVRTQRIKAAAPIFLLLILYSYYL
jgi:hypothetical protein